MKCPPPHSTTNQAGPVVPARNGCVAMMGFGIGLSLLLAVIACAANCSGAVILPTLYIHAVSNYAILNFPGQFTLQQNVGTGWTSVLVATDSCIVPIPTALTIGCQTLRCNPVTDPSITNLVLDVDGVDISEGLSTNFVLTALVHGAPASHWAYLMSESPQGRSDPGPTTIFSDIGTSSRGLWRAMQ